MVGIDRQAKLLHLQSGGVIAYDILVLTPGRQYHPSLPEQPAPPRRVEAVNNGTDVKMVLDWLQSACASTDGILLVRDWGLPWQTSWPADYHMLLLYWQLFPFAAPCV